MYTVKENTVKKPAKTCEKYNNAGEVPYPPLILKGLCHIHLST